MDGVLRLLESGDWAGLQDMDLEEVDQDGWSALFHSVSNNNLPFVDCLLAEGSNPNKTDCAGRTPLLVSVTVNNVEIVRSLVLAGAELEHSGLK